jgi:hypothetical protein
MSKVYPPGGDDATGAVVAVNRSISLSVREMPQIVVGRTSGQRPRRIYGYPFGEWTARLLLLFVRPSSGPIEGGGRLSWRPGSHADQPILELIKRAYRAVREGRCCSGKLGTRRTLSGSRLHLGSWPTQWPILLKLQSEALCLSGLVCAMADPPISDYYVVAFRRGE